MVTIFSNYRLSHDTRPIYCENLVVGPLIPLRSVAKIWSTHVLMSQERPLWIRRNNRLRAPKTVLHGG